MSVTIRIPLDEDSRKRLYRLVRTLELRPSQVLCEALRTLESTRLRKRKGGLIGIGQFSSDQTDLGSNKKHMRGFGK